MVENSNCRANYCKFSFSCLFEQWELVYQLGRELKPSLDSFTVESRASIYEFDKWSRFFNISMVRLMNNINCICDCVVTMVTLENYCAISDSASVLQKYSSHTLVLRVTLDPRMRFFFVLSLALSFFSFSRARWGCMVFSSQPFFHQFFFLLVRDL